MNRSDCIKAQIFELVSIACMYLSVYVSVKVASVYPIIIMLVVLITLWIMLLAHQLK